MKDEVYKLPQSSILDLHHFNPNEVTELVREFIWSCKQNGIKHGIIIHGKGKGSLRETTHSVLKESPEVKSFSLGSTSSPENWGQTSFQILD
jgi:DNA-nicking Smr family endonuclease